MFSPPPSLPYPHFVKKKQLASGDVLIFGLVKTHANDRRVLHFAWVAGSQKHECRYLPDSCFCKHFGSRCDFPLMDVGGLGEP